jgi:hypothetical protein
MDVPVKSPDDHLLPDFSKKNDTAKPGEHKIPPLFVRKFPDKGGGGTLVQTIK